MTIFRFFRRKQGATLVAHDPYLDKLTTGAVVYCPRTLPSWWRSHGGGL